MQFLQGPTRATELTYNDVFLAPSCSDVTSRFDVDLSSVDGTGTSIPLVVASMTAVSGKRTAETVARRGGIAVIPQDIPASIVTNVIASVKQSDPIVETPITVDPEMPVGSVLSLIPKRSHGAAVVVEKGRPVGIVSTSDCLGVGSIPKSTRS